MPGPLPAPNEPPAAPPELQKPFNVMQYAALVIEQILEQSDNS